MGLGESIFLVAAVRWGGGLRDVLRRRSDVLSLCVKDLLCRVSGGWEILKIVL
jgi:hypothetical protein